MIPCSSLPARRLNPSEMKMIVRVVGMLVIASTRRFVERRKFRSDTDVLCLKLRRKPLTLALIPVQAGPSAVAPPQAHFEQYSFINRSNSRAIMPLLDASLSRIVADSFLL